MSDEEPGRAAPASFESEWRARFERFAARGGSDAAISGWSEHGLVRRMHVLARAMARARPAPGSRFLDLGCGSGVYCRSLAESGYRVVGADYSLGMTRRARANAGSPGGPPVRLVVADVYRPPFKKGVFEGLINVGVLQHLADGERAVASMATLVAPGGFAFLDTLNRFSFHAAASLVRDTLGAWRRGRFLPRRHAVRRRPGHLIEMARTAGLEVVVVKGVYILPRGLRWLEPILDALDGVHWPFSRRPVFLVFANAYLAVFCKA